MWFSYGCSLEFFFGSLSIVVEKQSDGSTTNQMNQTTVVKSSKAVLSCLPFGLHSLQCFGVFLPAEQPSSVDPGQPLVNAIRSDSALIGGNADPLRNRLL